jgi:hypothetical protein
LPNYIVYVIILLMSSELRPEQLGAPDEALKNAFRTAVVFNAGRIAATGVATTEITGHFDPEGNFWATRQEVVGGNVIYTDVIVDADGNVRRSIESESLKDPSAVAREHADENFGSMDLAAQLLVSSLANRAEEEALGLPDVDASELVVLIDLLRA